MPSETEQEAVSSGEIPEGVIEQFNLIQAQLSELCDDLERIADSLPDEVDHKLTARVSAQLVPSLSAAHDFEENQLFPIMVESAIDHEDMFRMIERLRYEHYQDDCFAEEVREALDDFVSSRKSLSPDALGYMLRGIFVSLRRHMQSERDVLRLARGGAKPRVTH